MTSHVAHVTLRAQRFVRARCEVENGKKLPIAARVTGQNFPDGRGSRERPWLRMQPDVQRRDTRVSNA
ncbi:hypothetical protein A8E81_35110 [Burkholderia cenocepacia]|nr:hypothetical protein A8E75_13035 [Burkholderia cenocepacia]ONV21726.1 hypothetical protein A8E74_17130 [Burkholderia cenocepacia]ONV22701.1 hypothetical protein A8E77_32160 [Burkholderia cenocepacia]ONV33979.1 hypothetical protein A8E78_10975 [Burkholderia cenocepacia]ONV41137.1 hypothetical protein A8E82_17105 [Burkholderia cenocepacia]